MQTTYMTAVMKEFPWLARYNEKIFARTQKTTDHATVERIDGSLLHQTVGFDADFIFLVGENGEEIAEVGRSERKNWCWKKVVTNEDESVGDVLNRLGAQADAVRYVIKYLYSYQNVVVYKLPRGATSLLGWLRERHQQAELELKNKFAEIDAQNQ